MNERIKEGDNVLRILPQNSLNNFTVALEDTFFFEYAECIHDVLSESERYYFWNLELGSFLKDAIEINMSDFSCMLMNKNIITMSVSKPYNITNH